MRVSAYRSLEHQPTLFAADLKSSAAVRNVCGEFAELCTSRLTYARRMRTDSRAEICPDLHLEDNVYFECKSVGRNNFTIIYQHRQEKDLRFVENGNELFYWIWHHNGRVGSAASADDARRILAAGLSGLYVLGHAVLSDLLSGPTVTLNSHYYSNHRADAFRGSGWKLKIRDIRNVCGPVGTTAPMWIRGVPVRSVPVYSSCYGSRLSFWG